MLASLLLTNISEALPLNRLLHTSTVMTARRWQKKSTPSFAQDFSNPVREVAGMKAPPPEKGHIYDNKPLKINVKAGCLYTWCGCGLARTQQPLCDGTCEVLYMKKVMKGGPVKYIAPENKDVWFCNCKQTNNKPFCDGTHRDEDIQKHRFDSPRQLWEPRKK